MSGLDYLINSYDMEDAYKLDPLYLQDIEDLNDLFGELDYIFIENPDCLAVAVKGKHKDGRNYVYYFDPKAQLPTFPLFDACEKDSYQLLVNDVVFNSSYDRYCIAVLLLFEDGNSPEEIELIILKPGTVVQQRTAHRRFREI